VVELWERHVKTNLKRLIRREEAERNKNHNIMENHLYECFYDIMGGETPETDKYYTLQRYKAKKVNLHSKKRTNILLDTHANDKMDGKDPTLYHVVQQRRRRELREIQDTDGTTHTSPTNMRNTFVRHLAQKFGPITVDENAITALLHNMPQVNSSIYALQLDRPITSDEIHALRAGARQNASDLDGLSLEFYTANSDTIRMDIT
jgi:hypothetical protein